MVSSDDNIPLLMEHGTRNISVPQPRSKLIVNLSGHWLHQYEEKMEDTSSGGSEKDDMGRVSRFRCAEGVVLFPKKSCKKLQEPIKKGFVY